MIIAISTHIICLGLSPKVGCFSDHLKKITSLAFPCQEDRGRGGVGMGNALLLLG
jgi:hypothetical protein